MKFRRVIVRVTTLDCGPAYLSTGTGLISGSYGLAHLIPKKSQC